MMSVLLLLLITCVMCQRDEDYPLKPDRCQPPIDFLYRQCCVFPPFFTREAARTCGALLEINFIRANVTALRRQTIRGCEHWRCVLKKYDLLKLDGKLDDEKYFAHLNRWVDLNPAFANVMSNAKMHCKLGHRHLMPLDACEFYNLHACIRNFINRDCPQYIATKECNEVKEFNDECRDFFIKK